MTANPTPDPDTYSRELIKETIRPGLTDCLEANFEDPNASDRGKPISDPDEPGTWPPLVVTALPSGGRQFYPHVVVSEDSDSAGPIDARPEFAQHDYQVGVKIHATTTTQMFNLRGLVVVYFLKNRAVLRNAGFVIKSPEDNSTRALEELSPP